MDEKTTLIEKLFDPVMGAIVGFLLAQVVQVAVIAWNYFKRPKLVIGDVVEVSTDDPTDACSYTFCVQNKGLSIATSVKFQLIKIEFLHTEKCGFKCISEHVYNLPIYNSQSQQKYAEAVLIPNATIHINLAFQPDYNEQGQDIITPASQGLPDFYDTVCEGAEKYRFTVVAFDDKAHYAQKVLTISS